jgi:hypothetical protein
LHRFLRSEASALFAAAETPRHQYLWNTNDSPYVTGVHYSL